MARRPKSGDVYRWGVFEAVFESDCDYANPLQDIRVRVHFDGPCGAKHTRDAFWDGRRTWRVRFSPEAAGPWRWRSRASRRSDGGLHGRSGRFRCTVRRGTAAAERHGPLRVAENGWHLAHDDGTAWFWMADTCWNGALLSDARDWEVYLADRASKGFTAVQFVATQWRAAYGDAQGRVAYTGRRRIAVDPVFFQRLDARIRAMLARDLVPAPVMFWALPVNPEMSPGTSLSADQLVVLGRHMVARWGACHPVWLMGGDGHYGGRKAARWRKVGRGIFGGRPDQVVTMHPSGLSWVADEFRREKWFAFNGYQSGHGDAERDLRWLTEGPPAMQWTAEPHHPVINLEPNYEGHRGYTHGHVHDAADVRRAAYWSLLVHPPAGVTYGHHGIWPWPEQSMPPLNHVRSGASGPWYEAMKAPGSEDMRRLRACFEALEWWRLRPAPEMVARQPGRRDPSRFVAVARSECGRFALVYAPRGGRLALRTEVLDAPDAARWFNPRTGRWRRAPAPRRPVWRPETPDAGDWVLWIGQRRLEGRAVAKGRRSR